MSEAQSFFGIIGQNEKMQSIFRLIKKVGRTDSTVLITGQSGTGKEVVARAIHQCSSSYNQPIIPVNCGAIPSELLESELFGYEKGAFTGAIKTKAGKFEMAGSGTIFLDEIGDMPAMMQVKILRILQEREYERVGGNQTYKCRARIITATNKNLEDEVKAGKFREDLYYRLNVIPVHIPPLNERKDDLGILIKYFYNRFVPVKNPDIKSIDKEALEHLIKYDWPGNVRELENIMERMIILADGNSISVDDIPDKVKNNQSSSDVEGKSIEEVVVDVLKDFSVKIEEGDLTSEATNIAMQRVEMDSRPSGGNGGSGLNISLGLLKAGKQNLKELIDEIEVQLINEALEESDGVKQVAADILGIKRTTLTEKIKKYNEAIVN
ncbi:MAG: sigma-54-dependent Fis family transcriptional regulator [Nitrospinae bacterium]|nr:sigma-54-dependent Fis family transcriptional regulator [Nitrospinota bacterium]